MAFTTFPVEWTHTTYLLNQHLAADGSVTEGGVADNTQIDEATVKTVFRDLRDPLHLATGGTLGRVHRGMTLIDMRGRLKSPDGPGRQAALEDKIRDFKQAFDPAVCLRDSPSTDGAYEWRFAEATADTGTYANGRIDQVYYCRPVDRPVVTETIDRPSSHPFRLGLVAPDPRAYERAEQTLVLTPGSPSGNILNRGTVAAPLKLVVVMAGAGSVGFTLTRGSVAFGLDLSGMTGGDVVTVVFETCGPYGEGRLITKNSTRLFALKLTAASTWLDVPVGSTAVSITNTTNVTSATLSWHSARP